MADGRSRKTKCGELFTIFKRGTVRHREKMELGGGIDDTRHGGIDCEDRVQSPDVYDVPDQTYQQVIWV